MVVSESYVFNSSLTSTKTFLVIICQMAVGSWLVSCRKVADSRSIEMYFLHSYLDHCPGKYVVEMND